MQDGSARGSKRRVGQEKDTGRASDRSQETRVEYTGRLWSQTKTSGACRRVRKFLTTRFVSLHSEEGDGHDMVGGECTTRTRKFNE
ncbi:hypothetical protein PIB30_076086 [Stylosanthes scabra]|uniref:Uncharacterized protein n=1 Tax=Stylosanthes scabra TaxID=79078 RepID=A0ABU6SSA1_9FABA|nr:hypothetical protein [Stylosanthes scabra]